MYVTINVRTVALVRVRIKVITNVIPTTAPVDNESTVEVYDYVAVLIYFYHNYS